MKTTHIGFGKEAPPPTDRPPTTYFIPLGCNYAEIRDGIYWSCRRTHGHDGHHALEAEPEDE